MSTAIVTGKNNAVIRTYVFTQDFLVFRIFQGVRIFKTLKLFLQATNQDYGSFMNQWP